MKATMKWVCALALVGGCAVDDPVSDQAEQAVTTSGTVWHSTQNGGAAIMSFYDNETYGYVTASEQGTGANRVANLNFQIQGPDPASQVCYTYSDPWWGSWTYCYYTGYISEWGWGQIPGSDLSVSANAGTARLHTTTDPSSFVIQKCSYNWWSWYWSCSTGGSESFDLAYNKDGFMSYSFNGTQQSNMGGFGVRTAGKYDQNSARVNGTAAGHTISNSYGMILDSHGTNVSRDIVNVGP